MKKAFNVGLVCIYINFCAGCMSTRTVTKYPADVDRGENDDAIQVTTSDSLHYTFEGKQYAFKDDILIGEVQQPDSNRTDLVKIPIKDIARVQYDVPEFSAVKTIGFVIGVTVIIGAVVLLANPPKVTASGPLFKGGLN